MPNRDSETAITLKQVREAVNRWSRQGGLLRIRDLGDKIAVQRVTVRGCYTLKVWNQFEHRFISDAHIPYDGGPLDDVGQPPGMWDMTIPPPSKFEKSEMNFQVPHTERVGVCPECHSGGSVVVLV